MSEIGAATRAHYDRYPYDFETSLHLPMQLEGTLLGEVVGSIGPEEIVVDAGCGTGLVLRMASTRSRRTLGVDLSLGSLRRAAASSPGVALVQGDLLSLPLRANGADVVISRGVIMTTGDPERAFSELARATRPGGRLYVRVYNRRHPYAWIYRLFGPPCRRLARRVAGRVLLAAMVLPPFFLALQLAFLALKGRPTWIPARVLWNFFADQLLVPHNSFHTIDEVREWGTAAGCRCLGSRTITLGQQIELLFVKGEGAPHGH